MRRSPAKQLAMESSRGRWGEHKEPWQQIWRSAGCWEFGKVGVQVHQVIPADRSWGFRRGLGVGGETDLGVSGISKQSSKQSIG